MLIMKSQRVIHKKTKILTESSSGRNEYFRKTELQQTLRSIWYFLFIPIVIIDKRV